MDRYQKIQYYTSIFLKILIGALVLISAIRQDIFLVFTSLLVLFLSFTPAIITRNFKVKIPIEVDFVLTIILYLCYGLGEYSGFYVKIWWWDLFLHFGNSIVLGMVGFIFAYSLLLTSKISAKPILISVFALSFSVLVGVIWEIFEFGMDSLFGFTMQKSGLVDTMTDLIVNFFGASIVSVFGFMHLRKPEHGLFEKILRIFVKNKSYEK
ncbi:MAG: hypothetical protein PHH24_01085 [Candidatus Moranbacteria bacterium]|jgi:hypothetical protein|nr:hypothetical protein [Candidatus Moranbacteria bacterium]MDD5651852.1 hypothetical protein [Candidatus Moranbacteria bacterium]MDX9855336.1 hypothetical protein [Candidatus Moranbacteria bacterium]